MLRRTQWLVAASLATSVPAFAHHGVSSYDLATEIVLEGVIAEVKWRNPHIYFTIETTDDEGEPLRQEIEGGSISALSTMGLERDSLAVGERVVVRGRPHRRGPGRTVLGIDATTADGVVVPLEISAAVGRLPGTAVASSIAGRWVRPVEAFRALNASAPNWPMTEKGRSVFTGRGRQADCVPAGAPTLMLMGTLIDVSLGETAAVFALDWMGAKRVIHLDIAEHPADLERSLQGHSIGRWEGNTLVIDTVGFTEHPEGMGFGLPSGLGKHMVERLSLSPNRRHLNYEIMVEDPEYLTEPIHAAASWEYRPDLEPSGADCDLESARRFLEDE